MYYIVSIILEREDAYDVPHRTATTDLYKYILNSLEHAHVDYRELEDCQSEEYVGRSMTYLFTCAHIRKLLAEVSSCFRPTVNPARYLPPPPRILFVDDKRDAAMARILRI